eukprot:TRINITY_DN2437_c0_g1_i1.p1 TRINITY_DN2437_c0_g1~~TRINITY_DN2437_c0_g1_i1.p1  ORF type:complete len:351 (-),score=84.81 TRINITY_DN2437_c0_g1_i1:106-1158(-)
MLAVQEYTQWGQHNSREMEATAGSTSSLDQLKKFTTIVADTGDFGQLEKYKPQDSTTNPSLILAAAQLESYKPLVSDAVAYAKKEASSLDQQVEKAMDKLAVNFGIEILKIVPGRVSTEIDARLSFDTEATLRKGRELIELYKKADIPTDRVLLKIASTWEGLQAAKVFEKEGLHVNMTLLFCLEQAALAGEVGATLISPFAGRITDFFKQKEGRKDNYPADEDPGVKSVREIYTYMRKHGYATVVMGASFRTADQVKALAGCDLLTVAPQLLGELAASTEDVKQTLSKEEAVKSDMAKLNVDEGTFKFRLNDDEMASFKVAEGIRKFAADARKLEEILRKLLQQQQDDA